MAVCGYPPRDLLLKTRFVPDNEASLAEIASHTGNVPMVVGYVALNRGEKGRRFYNAAAWCQAGSVVLRCYKCLLPTYDVFDEDRYFVPAQEPGVIEHKGCRIGITICEDIWTAPFLETRRRYTSDPLKILSDSRIDLLINLSASPTVS